MPLWMELKNQVIESWNQEVEEAALSTLTAVVSVIDKSGDDQDKLNMVADYAFKGSRQNLNEPKYIG